MQKPIRGESCIKFDTLPAYCRTQQEEEETAAVAVSLPTFGRREQRAER